jgi:hypothetical protein
MARKRNAIRRERIIRSYVLGKAPGARITLTAQGSSPGRLEISRA